MARRITGVQLRSGSLFVFGLAGVTYETLVSASDRPTLLILFSAMLGLPLFLKADEKKKDATADVPTTRPPE